MTDAQTTDSVKQWQPDYDVIVVGGGAAGLSLLGRLTQNNFNRVMLLEKDTLVGGIWRTTLYPDLKIHTKSFNYKFFDYKALESIGERATKEEVLDYFKHYIRDRGLTEFIRTSSKVIKVIHVEDNSRAYHCEVFIEDLQSGREYVLTCNYVVFALGFSSAGMPSMPAFINKQYANKQYAANEKNATAKIVHSSEFSQAMLDDVTNNNKQVCLFGGGKSAHDIALQFVLNNQSQHLTWVYTKLLWGVNYEQAYRFAELQDTDSLLYRYGLFYKEDPNSERTKEAAKNLIKSGFYLNVEQDNIDVFQFRGALYKPEDIQRLRNNVKRIKSAVDSVNGNRITLENGTNLQADYLICATGYARAANLPVIKIRRGNAVSKEYDPRDTPILYRSLVDIKLPAIIIFTGEVPLQQVAFGYSVYAEWLCRFLQNRSDDNNRYEAMVEEVRADEREFGDSYRWCGDSRQHNLSQGMPYMMFSLMYRLKCMQRIVSDLGFSDDVAMRLFEGITNEQVFKELNADLQRVCRV